MADITQNCYVKYLGTNPCSCSLPCDDNGKCQVLYPKGCMRLMKDKPISKEISKWLKETNNKRRDVNDTLPKPFYKKCNYSKNIPKKSE